MEWFDKYLAYWPVLAGGLCFLLAGLWLWLVSERAMERSPKALSWVRDYRKPGFPLRAEVLSPEPLRPLLLALVLVFSLLAAALYILMEGKSIYGVWTFEVFTLIRFLQLILSVIGAGAMYLLLWLLFGGWFPALLGALLFAASPVYGHAAASLLTCSLLLLILFLRKEKPGYPAELLYLGALVLFLLAAGAAPVLLCLFPLLIAAHLWRIFAFFREGALSPGRLVLLLIPALLCWAVFFLLVCAVRRLILFQLPIGFLPKLLEPRRLSRACTSFLDSISFTLFPRLGRNLLLFPLLDAPLFGLGLWGVLSAGGMALKRKNVRGTVCLIILAALTVLWLFSARYLLMLGFCLTAGCMLKNSELGGKKVLPGVIVLAGLLYDLAIVLAAALRAIPTPLIVRLF